MKVRRVALFASLLFVALALCPAMAHLLELPNKMALDRDEYFTVQQIYRGWALLGVVVFGALSSTLALTITLRCYPRARAYALLSLLCIAGTQLIFWMFTQPANAATRNWTVLPAAWSELRLQWELSHAASALLNLVALLMMIACALALERRSRGGVSAQPGS